MLLGLMQALLVLVVLAAVGRVVLALLPAGAIGGHGVGELPVTWAASHLLGMAVLAFEVLCARAFGLATGVWMLAPWVLIALGRAALLPGALVPRHAPRTAPRSALALGLSLVAAGLATTPWWIQRSVGAAYSAEGFDLGAPRHGIVSRLGVELGLAEPRAGLALLGVASVLALLVLVADALAVARRAPIARALVLAWLAWLTYLAGEIVVLGEGASALLALGGGAAASVGWIRRGDRRALALAALALSASVVFEPVAWRQAGAALVVLALASPRAAWKTTLVWCSAAGLVLVLAAGRRIAPALDVMATPGTTLVAFLVPALAIAASALAMRVIALRKPDPRERIHPTARESTVIAAMLVGGALAALGEDGERWQRFAPGMPHVPMALLALLPLVPLLVGLVGAPDERTLPPA
ncbi:MAG: hypothetical protein IPJ77_05910 [Planctomycetes bacterium]|nr:hypothetical protein [Planctomycetota bacterium]